MRAVYFSDLALKACIFISDSLENICTEYPYKMKKRLDKRFSYI